MFRPFFAAFFQKSGADLAGKPLAAIFFLYMNGINTNIITIQNPQSCSNDLIIFFHVGTDGALRNGVIHGWDHRSVYRICCSFQVKKAGDPEIGNVICQDDIITAGI